MKAKKKRVKKENQKKDKVKPKETSQKLKRVKQKGKTNLKNQDQMMINQNLLKHQNLNQKCQKHQKLHLRKMIRVKNLKLRKIQVNRQVKRILKNQVMTQMTQKLADNKHKNQFDLMMNQVKKTQVNREKNINQVILYSYKLNIWNLIWNIFEQNLLSICTKS